MPVLKWLSCTQAHTRVHMYVCEFVNSVTPSVWCCQSKVVDIYIWHLRQTALQTRWAIKGQQFDGHSCVLLSAAAVAATCAPTIVIACVVLFIAVARHNKPTHALVAYFSWWLIFFYYAAYFKRLWHFLCTHILMLVCMCVYICVYCCWSYNFQFNCLLVVPW